MPANGLGWPGSVFTVGTCRGLLLALLLEPSIVTAVSDIMLRRSARSVHHTRSRIHARSLFLSRLTLVPEWKATRSKHPGEQNGEPNRYDGTTGEPIAGHLLCVFTTARVHGGLYHCALPTVLTAEPLFSHYCCHATAATHSAGSIDEIW